MPQLDWSLAQIPDFAGNALKARDEARLRNNDVGEQNALKLYASDPTAGTQQLLQYNPKLAISLQAQQQQTAQATADRKRAALQAAAKAVAPVLSSIPPEQRSQKLLDSSAQLKNMYGLDDNDIQMAAKGDLSDQALALWSGQDPNATTLHEVKNLDGSTSFKYLPNRPPPAYAQQGAPQAASMPQAAPMAAQPAQAAPAPSGGGFDGFYGDYLAKVEGGYSPEDGNGAPVNFGINQKSNPDVNVARLTPEQAKKITYERYWKPSGADDLPPALAAVQADTAFNMGIPAAKQLLAQSGGDPQKYLDLRAARYQAIAQANPGKARFLPTWLDRNQQLAAYVQGQGQQAPQAAPAPPEAAPAPRAPGYVNGIYTVPGDAAPDPAWKPDGKGFLVNKNGDTKPDPRAETGTKLDDDTVDYVAQQYVLTGQLPPLGAGKAGTENRDQILKRAAAIEKETGATGADAVTRHVMVKTSTAALQKVTQQRAMIESFEDTAKRNGDLMLTLAPKGGGQTNSPVLNRWLQAGRQNIAGDPDVTKFNIALGTFADEYAKIVSGSTGSAGSTDSARKEAYDRLSKYATQGQLTAGIATMKQEMTNRTAALKDQEKALQETIRSGGKSAPADTAQTDATKPPKASGARLGQGGKYYAPDPNRPGSFPQIYQGDDGVWRMKSANGQLLKMVE